MLPDEYLAEEKVGVASHGAMELVLFEPSRPHKPHDESPSIKCGFRCESSAWSEPVPTRIASATIQSRGMDRCSGS